MKLPPRRPSGSGVSISNCLYARPSRPSNSSASAPQAPNRVFACGSSATATVRRRVSISAWACSLGTTGSSARYRATCSARSHRRGTRVHREAASGAPPPRRRRLRSARSRGSGRARRPWPARRRVRCFDRSPRLAPVAAISDRSQLRLPNAAVSTRPSLEPDMRTVHGGNEPVRLLPSTAFARCV